MAYNAGDVEAQLTLDRSPFTTGLQTARAEAEKFEKNKIKIPVELDNAVFNKSLTAMQARLTKLGAKTFKPKIRLDDVGQLPKITEITKRLDTLGKRVFKPKIQIQIDGADKLAEASSMLKTFSQKKWEVKVKLDISELTKDLQFASKQIDFYTRNRKFKINLETGELTKDLMFADRMIAFYTRDRRMHVNVDVDKGGVSSLLGLATAANAASTATNAADGGMSRYTKRLILMGTGIALIAAPALGILATLLASLPVVMAGAGLAITTLTLGFQNFGTAVSDPKTAAGLKEKKKALEELSPAARQVADIFNGPFKSAMKGLQQQVQQEIFKGFADDLKNVVKILPTFRQGLVDNATALNGIMRGMLGVVTSSKGLSIIVQVMNNMNKAMADLTPMFTLGTQTFMQLALVGSQTFGSLVTELNKFAVGFNQMVTWATQTGILAEAFRQLANVTGSLLYAFTGLMGAGLGAMAATGANLAKGFRLLTDALVALVPLLSDLSNVALNILNPALAALTPLFYQLRPLFDALVGLSAALSPFISALGEHFSGLLTFLVPVATWFVNLLTAVMDFLGPAAGPLLGTILALVAAYKTLSIIGATVTAVQALMTGGLWASITATNAWKGAMAIATAAQWLFNLSLWANPITWVVAGIVILIGIIIALAMNWDTVTAALIASWSWIKNTFDTVWGAISDWFLNVWSSITAAFTTSLNWVANTWNTVWQGIGNFFSTIWAGITNFFTTTIPAMWDTFTTGVSNAVTTAIKFLADLPNNIAYYLGYALGAAIRWAINFGESIGRGVTTAIAWFASLPEKIATFFTNAGTWLANTGIAIMNGLRDGAIAAWNGTVNFFTSLPGIIGNFFTGVGTWLYNTGSTLLTGLWNGIVTGWNATIAWFVALPGAIGNFFTTAGKWLYQTGSDILTGLWDGLVAGWNATIAWFANLPTNLKNFFVGAGNWLWQVGSDIISGLWNGLKAAWNGFWGWIGGLVDSFIQGFKDGLGIASPSTIFAEIGGFLIQGLLNGITVAWKGIVSFFTNIWTGITNIFTGNFQPLISNIVSGLNFLNGIWTTIWNAISSAFTFVWNLIKSIGTMTWSQLANYLIAGINAYNAFWAGIWKNILAFFVNIWNGIKAQAIALWNTISAFFTSALNTFVTFWSKIWNGILTFFVGLWNGIKAQAMLLWNTLYSWYVTSLNIWLAFWTGLWNNILNFFVTLWNNLKQAGINLWNTLYNFFVTALNGFKNFWIDMWNGIKSGFESVFNGIIDIAKRIWQATKDVFRGGINAVIGGVNWPIDKINGLFGISIPRIPEIPPFAVGGYLDLNTAALGAVPNANIGAQYGPGGPKDDRILSRLSPKEHVWSAKEVEGAGGHNGVAALRQMALQKAVPGFAGGGTPVLGGANKPGARPDGGQISPNFVPAIDRGSYVVPPDVAAFSINFLNALSARQPEAIMAAGGRGAPALRINKNSANDQGWFKDLPSYADGGNPAVGNAQRFAQSMNGKPYIWGGTGPAGMDCSGYMGAITHVLRGQSPFAGRIGVARSQPWPGFVNGLSSQFATGFNQTHTAGTLGGVNVESGSTPIRYPAKQGADGGAFTGHASLPQVGGVFASGGAGGGMIDIAALLAPIIKEGRDWTSGILDPVPPKPLMHDMGLGMYDKGAEGIIAKAQALMAFFEGIANEVQITGWATQALIANGQPLWYIPGILQQIQSESKGDPGAIQHGYTDVNSGGNEARGIMQVTPRTFAAYKNPRLPNIMAPVDNIAAGANWAQHAHGTGWFLPGPWHNHGYDDGGLLPTGITAAINTSGRTEAVVNGPQWDALIQAASGAQQIIEQNGGGGITRDEIKSIIAELMETQPLVGSINPQMPQGSSVKDLTDEIMFELRHTRRGKYDS